jgi:hypothetical protein
MKSRAAENQITTKQQLILIGYEESKVLYVFRTSPVSFTILPLFWVFTEDDILIPDQ